MKNSNQLHGHRRPVKEGSERTLDEVSIDRERLLGEAVSGIGNSMVREFALDGGSPTVAVTREEQQSFAALMKQVSLEYQAAISGNQLTVPAEADAFERHMQDMDPGFQAAASGNELTPQRDEADVFEQQMQGMGSSFQEATSGAHLTSPSETPGYATVAEAVGVPTHRLGREAVRSLQQEATDPDSITNNGINPAYLSMNRELENA